MKSSKLLAVTAIAFAMIGSAAFKNLPACCINFNTPPFSQGTVYRVYNASIYTSCGFTIKTDSLFINGRSYFNLARVEIAPAIFGSGNVVNTNNITLHFIRTGILNQGTISFDYLDRGGTENLSVNRRLYSGELSAAPANLGGATVSVTSTPIPLPARGKKGTVTITGKITEFNIGGQEFYIDNVCFR